MENENENEEFQEETLEETQDDVETSENNDGENQENQDKDLKTLEAQKAHWRKKAKDLEAKLQVQEPNKKPNTEQSGLTREQAIFFAKGGTEEDLKIAEKIAKLEDVSILVAMEDDYYKATIEKREKERKIKANSLKPSSGSRTGGERQKTPGEMTREEHEKWARNKFGN